MECKKDDIIAQLGRIERSPVFKESTKLLDFLKFIVVETLEGRQETLKQYTIATSAFKRTEDFNPTLDPIVRIQAGRLRHRLNTYYQNAGKEDPVTIALPKGSYVPEFVVNHARTEKSPDLSFPDKWNHSIAILPFRNLTGDSDKLYIAQGVSEELAMEFARYKQLCVIRDFTDPEPDSGGYKHKRNARARFEIRGSVRMSDKKIKVAVTLVDTLNSEQIFSKSYSEDLTPKDLIEIQEDIASEVSLKVGDYFEGVIFKKLFFEQRKDSFRDFQAYDALLNHYEYQRNPSESTFNKVVEGAWQAVKLNPDFGLGWAILSNLYIDSYALDHTDDATALAQGIEYGQKAVHFEPDSQMAHGYLGYGYFISGELALAKRHLHRALDINPHAAYFVGAMGWALALCGEWDAGIAMRDKSILLNPAYPSWFHLAGCLNAIRLGHYDTALEEALDFTTTDLYLVPLYRSFTYGLLNQQEHATQELNKLLEMKPDFYKKAELLLGMYIKFDDLKEKAIEGLNVAGLDM